MSAVEAPNGRQLLEAIRDGRHPRPNTAALLGLRLVEVGDGHTVFEWTADERFDNGDGSAHGGVLATIADFAVATAVRTRIPPSTYVVTTNLNITYVRGVPSDAGFVRGEGRVLKVGRTLAHAEATMTDADGRLCVHATGTCSILPLR